MPRLAPLFALCALPALADPSAIPAQTFTLDPSHASVTFTISHLGLTDYTGSFDQVEATLELDPANPAQAQLSVQIATGSLDLPAPPAGFLDDMLSATWLNAGDHPTITYRSTGVRLTDETTALIDGELTLLGITAPLTLEARYNGHFEAGVIEPHARLGFSATGTLNRSDHGLEIGLPAPGTTLGVGDAITVSIEAEFTGEPAN